jgi:hypothetical protein
MIEAIRCLISRSIAQSLKREGIEALDGDSAVKSRSSETTLRQKRQLNSLHSAASGSAESPEWHCRRGDKMSKRLQFCSTSIVTEVSLSAGSAVQAECSSVARLLQYCTE